jgi:hypothetical protein
VAAKDLHLEHLNIKTALLHGDLEEDKKTELGWFEF